MEATELLRTIAEKRTNAFEELKAVVDNVDPAVGYSAEDRAKKDKIHADIDDLDSREAIVKEQVDVSSKADEARSAMERFTRPDVDPDPAGSVDERAADWFRGKSGGKAFEEISLRGLKPGIRRTGGDGVEARVLTDGTMPAVSGGGATVATSFSHQLYAYLIFNSAIRQTRATVLTTDSGEPLVMPLVTAHPASGTVLPEGNTIQTSDPTFGQGTLHAYKYAQLVQVSNELLTDTSVDLLGYLAMAFGRALANGSGRDMIFGTGSSQPQGVCTGAVVGAGTIAKVAGGSSQSGIPTSNEIYDIYHAIIPPYRKNAEWLMADSALKAVRELKATTGQYLWTPGGLAGGVPNTLLDKPYTVDPNLTHTGLNATSIAFGDFSTFHIRDVGGLRFERSDDFAFNTDLVTFRAILRTDSLLLDQTGAIAVYVGGTA